MQSTQKAVEGATALFVCSVVVDDRRERQKRWHVLTERAWVRGVGIDLLLQSMLFLMLRQQPEQLAKHHWHVTNTPCKAQKKP